MRSVINAAIDAANKQKRFVAFDDTIEGETVFAEAFGQRLEADPQSALDVAERQRRIAAALDQLSPKQRAVIVMRYYLDMTETEIAAANHEPDGTVKWRLHTARNRLRGILKWGEA
jgi:RNA polymerase sigma factor (sigma-70 family)